MLNAWYPLNGDVRNQGIGDSELTQVVAPTFISGKFGTSLSGGAFKWLDYQSNSILNNNSLSIAFWVYVDMDNGTVISADDAVYNDFTTGNDNETVLSESGTETGVFILNTEGSMNSVMFGNYSGSTLGGKQFSIFNLPTSNDITLDWQNYSDGNYINILNETLSNCIPSRTWTHICVTYDNPTVKVWINGELLKTCGCVVDTTFNFETNVITNLSGRRYNDYRIYDHCLSKKEIMNLSKGLYSHYLLDGAYAGKETYHALVEYDGVENDIYAVESDTEYQVEMVNSDAFIEEQDFNEYDCAGYLNTGLRSSGLSASDDTKRYQKSSDFATSDYINCYFGGNCHDKMTVNFWAKMDDWSLFSDVSKFACCIVDDKNGGWSVESYNGYPSFVAYIDEVGYVRVTSSESFADISSGWHMFTCQYDGISLKIYLDGVLKGSNITGRTNALINYSTGSYLYIHAKPVSNDLYYSSGSEELSIVSENNEIFGDVNDPITVSSPIKMSDFRVYCTSLSDYSINELFDFKYSIDSNNNLHLYEMCESEGASTLRLYKKGTASVRYVLESDIVKLHMNGDISLPEFYED